MRSRKARWDARFWALRLVSGSVSDGLRPGLARAGRTHSLEGWTRGPALASFLAREAAEEDEVEDAGLAEWVGASEDGLGLGGDCTVDEEGAGASTDEGAGARREDCDLDGAGLRCVEDDEDDGRDRCGKFRCPAREEEESPAEGSMEAMAGDDMVVE